jgi:hypothetical protein
MDLWNSLIVPDPSAGRPWPTPQTHFRTVKTDHIGKIAEDAKSSRGYDGYLERFSRPPSPGNPAFWDGTATRIPNLARPSSPRPSAVHQQADTQYPGSTKPIVSYCRGRKLKRALSRRSLLRKPHPLSHVTTLEPPETKKDQVHVSDDTKETLL